jgi:hypothetical protein
MAICKQCGNIIIEPHLLGKNRISHKIFIKRQFCSNSCSTKFTSKFRYKICEKCNKKFESKSDEVKICTKCSKIKKCLYCNKETKNNKFCSLSCCAKYSHKNNILGKLKPKIKRVCIQCKNTFIPIRKERILCSNKCAAVYRHKVYNFHISKSCRKFLNRLENILEIKIEREFMLDYRFFDGKYKNILFEIDGPFYHSLPRQKKIDILKNNIALKNNFKLYRFEVGNVSEINKVIIKNTESINQIKSLV